MLWVAGNLKELELKCTLGLVPAAVVLNKMGSGCVLISLLSPKILFLGHREGCRVSLLNQLWSHLVAVSAKLH